MIGRVRKTKKKKFRIADSTVDVLGQFQHIVGHFFFSNLSYKSNNNNELVEHFENAKVK